MQPTKTDQRQAHILLVDDDPGYGYLIQLVLGALPFQVELNVLTGSSHVMDYLLNKGQFSKKHRPDLIILDRTLTPKDGIKLLIEIKKHKHLSLIPTLIMSGHSGDDVVNEAYQSGANSYIVKPDSLEGFMETFRTVLGYWLVQVRLPSP